MIEGARELYQEVILDHYRRPRNFRALEHADRHAAGRNPLCGDVVDVYLRLGGGRIVDIAFQGQGCAICTASSSLMTEALAGHTMEEALALFASFHELLTADGAQVGGLGKLEAFAGVREFPVRVKCATLPWHTFKAALEQREQPVTTE